MKRFVSRTKPVSILTALSVLVLTRLVSRADAAVNDVDPAAAQLPEVVVTGQQKKGYKSEKLASPKYTEPLRDVPQTVTVIPQAVIEEQGASTLRDVLRNTPGISMQAGEGGTPAGDQMTIRGFSARTDLYIDNVRDFGGYSRDPFNLEQVEVAKGPSSSTSGRGSTGGSINLVSKAPHAEVERSASVGFGTDAYQRYTLDMNQPLKEIGLEGMALRVNAMLHEAEVSERDEVENGRWGVAPSLRIGLDTPTRVTLSYFQLNQDNVPDYGQPWVPNTQAALSNYRDMPSPVDRSNYYGMVNRDFENVGTHLFSAVIEHDFSETLRLTSQTRYGTTLRDSLITAPRFNANGSTDIRRTDWKSRDQEDTILINQTDLNIGFATGSIKHALVTGLEFSNEFEENFARTLTGAGGGPVTDLYDPDPYSPFSGTLVRTGAKTQSDLDTVAGYVFDTATITEQWEVSGGVRFDSFDTEYISTATNGTETPLNRADGTVSWRSGVVYKPVENGSIYFGVGTSFNPSSEGLSLSSTATAANNINIDPEENRSYELGAKWDLFGDRLSLSAALFRTDKTNARTEDPTDPTDMIVLSGEQRVQGIELGAAGDITPEWHVFAGYVLMQSEIMKSENAAEVGQNLANTPEYSLSLWTSYELPWNWEIGGGLQYVDDRYSSTANTRSAPDHWLLDAVATYRVNENVEIRANLYNLTDEEYIDYVGGGHYIPGAGRSATVTTSFKF
jgi:catecholate siderophore receptor